MSAITYPSVIDKIDGAAKAGNEASVIPRFLRRDAVAVYSYDSVGRLTVVKGDQTVCLTADDLAVLRHFVGRIAGID